MSEHHAQSDAELHDELVAYLDGELDAEASRRLEERLSHDDAARTQLQRLEKVWDLLDRLPRAEVGEDFMKTTVEMVAVAAAADLRRDQAALPGRRVRLGLTIATGILLAGILGFAGVLVFLPDKNNALLNDLPVIENLELLQKADSLAFLNSLRNEGVFLSQADAAVSDVPPLEIETLAERRARIEMLGQVDRERLQRQFDQFLSLPPAEQDRLRRFHAQVTQSPELYLTLMQYFDWLKNLQTSERAELLAEASEKRLEKIHEIKKKQDAEELRRLVRNAKLSEGDAKVLFGWLESVAMARQQQLINSLPEDRRQWLDKLDPNSQARKRAIAAAAMTRWNVDDKEIPPIDQGEINRLMNDLSPETSAILKRQPDLKGRVAILREWAQKAIWAGTPQFRPVGVRQQPKPEELTAIFEQLKGDEKDRLLGLSQEDMQARLREMYFRQKSGRGGFRQGGNPGGNRPGEGGGPDRPPFGGPRGGRGPDDRPAELPPTDLPRDVRPGDAGGPGERPRPMPSEMRRPGDRSPDRNPSAEANKS